MTPPGVGRRPQQARASSVGDWTQALRVLSEGAESLPGNRFPWWHCSVLTGMLSPCEYPSIFVIIIPK